MTEENTTPNQTGSNDSTPSEVEILDELKTTAQNLGINPGNRGVDALRKAIKEKMAETSSDEKSNASEQGTSDEIVQTDNRPMTKGQIREKQRKEELRLIRCRIQNMNPTKADLHGEIITVRTKYLGIVKKFIPFGEATENGYHIPYILYKELKNRKFLHVSTKTNRVTGQIEVSHKKWISEFAIEELDPLTPEELSDLKAQQAAAAGLSN